MHTPKYAHRSHGQQLSVLVSQGSTDLLLVSILGPDKGSALVCSPLLQLCSMGLSPNAVSRCLAIKHHCQSLGCQALHCDKHSLEVYGCASYRKHCTLPCSVLCKRGLRKCGAQLHRLLPLHSPPLTTMSSGGQVLHRCQNGTQKLISGDALVH